MKLTTIFLALAFCLVSLVSAPASALPPDCEDVCFFRPPAYHCHTFFYGTITCGQYCSLYPGSCGMNLQAGVFSEALPWEVSAQLDSDCSMEAPKARTPDAFSEAAS